MAQRQAVVGGDVACAEARAAEARLDDRAGLEQLCRRAVARERKRNGDARRIDVQAEFAVAGRAAAQNVGSLGDIVEQAAAAARDHALICPDAVVMQLVGQLDMGLREAAGSILLDLLQQLLRIGKEFPDGIGVRRMERQGDHRLDLVQLDGDHLVIPGFSARMQLSIVLRAAVRLKEAARDLVRLPDGGQAGRLRRHDVDAVAEIDGQICDAGAAELQHAVVDKAAGERFLHKRNGNVVRADAAARRTGHVYENDLGHVDVPGVLEQLLGKLRTALADCHRAERAVARMGVRAEDHRAAARELFTGIGMDDALVGGHIDAAILLRGGQAEDMVVLVDGAADCAEAVMAVRQRIRDREFLHARGARLLDNTDIGDVVRNHGIKADLQALRVAGRVVRLQDLPCHGLLSRFVLGNGRLLLRTAVYEIDAVLMKLNHNATPGFVLKVFSGRLPHRQEFECPEGARPLVVRL